MDNLVMEIAAIGVAGVAAQWLSWRLRLPAIVLLLLAGLALGPFTGLVVPERDFGELFRPLVAIAVAIILFEGGITLKFAEIRNAVTGVRRLVTIGAPLGWLLGSLAAHYIAGLDWPAATILGGLFVVTGPTVIMPLLRQAKLAPRPAALLRWEAIVNDPIGALFAVIAFETALVLGWIQTELHEVGGHGAEELLIRAGVALAVSLLGGFLLARFIVWVFNRGLAPEYLKSPILLVAVLVGYEMSQLILEESGLLTVTVMGVTIANAKLASLTELKRFKEIITILLVSGVFILLTATLNAETVALIDWRIAAYVAAMLLLVRPLTIFTATIGAGLTWGERALVAWIAPRGVVAVAVAGLFGAAISASNPEDGAKMTAIAFALVFATVLLHGFTLAPLARLLGLASARQEGVLFVGGGPFVTAFAQRLKELDYPVMIADSNYVSLRGAREAGLPTYYGEILSETADHSIDHNPYGHLIVATANDSYNTLVASDFGPELGRSRVFQLAPFREQSEQMSVSYTLGGRVLGDMDLSAMELSLRLSQGWKVKITKLTEQYGFEAALRENGGVLLGVIRESGALLLAEAPKQKAGAEGPLKPTLKAEEGDRLILMAPPKGEAAL